MFFLLTQITLFIPHAKSVLEVFILLLLMGTHLVFSMSMRLKAAIIVPQQPAKGGRLQNPGFILVLFYVLFFFLPVRIYVRFRRVDKRNDNGSFFKEAARNLVSG